MEKYTLKSTVGQDVFYASLKDGSLLLEETLHYVGAPGEPWIDAIYTIDPSEFAHILALFELPASTEILEALKTISESGRAEEFDRKIMNDEIKVANKDTWWSFDD